MASKAIKRRTCNADTDNTSEKRMETTISHPVTEPLLGNGFHEDNSNRYEPTARSDFFDGTRQECLRWAHLLSVFMAQSARKIGAFHETLIQEELDVNLLWCPAIDYIKEHIPTVLHSCLINSSSLAIMIYHLGVAVNVLSGLGSLLARLFGCSSAPKSSQNGQIVPLSLSPLQEERLRLLRQRLGVPYDCSSVKHQDALKELWRLAYPNRQLPPLKSDLWKEMGWQNSNPSTDFRAGGFMSLENLIYFARNYPDSFHRLLHKVEGKRAEWEYPFAAGGVNISYMLVQMLDLQSGKMSTKAGVHFVQLLEDDGAAFDNLFCVAFQVLDAQWLARRASYMEFNEVLKSTRIQLEKELTTGGISSVRDMPSFRMLKR